MWRKFWHGIALVIEEGEIFEKKIFKMIFKMFWKVTIIKTLAYTVKANCVNLIFRVKLAKIIIKMIDLFLQVARLQQLMVTRVSKTLNTWILFCKTWMVTENCYRKILLKAKLITSSLLNLKFSKFILNILTFLKLHHCCILHDYLSFIFLNFTFQF